MASQEASSLTRSKCTLAHVLLLQAVIEETVSVDGIVANHASEFYICALLKFLFDRLVFVMSVLLICNSTPSKWYPWPSFTCTTALYLNVFVFTSPLR